MLLHLLLAVTLSASAPSDPVAIYAIVDRVVLEGPASAPTAIQVWGTFSLSEQKPGDNYRAPVKGYMYFKLDTKPEVARAEWNDLKAVAGKKELVGFGVKWQNQAPGRVRCATEKVADPDPYYVGIGLFKMKAERNTGWDIARGLVSGNAVAAPCAAK